MKLFRFILISVVLSLQPLLLSAMHRQLFDSDWRFKLGDVADASSTSFDDRDWRVLDLPHDWSVEGSFDRQAPAGNDGAYLPTGVAWYRKSFSVSRVSDVSYLYFEGVYMNSDVYVNGQRVGGHPYGYSSFWCDVSQVLKPGVKNVVAVRVDNSQQKNCRWYTGSGIYRHVWLVTAASAHFEPWGVQVKATPTDEQLKTWTLEFRSEIANPDNQKPEFRFSLLDAEGKTVVMRMTGTTSQSITVQNPRLWTPDAPELYTLRAELFIGGKVVDEEKVKVGFRTVEWNVTEGLKLNGKHLVLNGACVHHDNGVLGAASFDAAEARKVELLKKGGFNAVRTSHNPPSESFLDACDRLGMLCIDEAFDGWRESKNKYDYSTLIDKWWQQDIAAMVKRDRNHPSVFCWSIGNEVIERKKIEVVRTAHQLAESCRQLDASHRPVTSALAAWDSDWEIYDPLAAEHDIVGYNYMMHKADEDHLRVPGRVMWQTESYPREAFKNWERMQSRPYIIGDFVWTGIDYLGESGIGRWYYEGDVPGEHYERPLYPWHAAYCGDIDLTGLRKPISYYRAMLYGDPKSDFHLTVREPEGYRGKVRETLWGTWPTFDSWSWPGWDGKDIEVEVYSRYPRVRLYLNDQLVGEQEVGQESGFCARFTLKYKAGVLRAEGLDESEMRATQTLSTAGVPQRLRTTADKTLLSADGQDLSFVEIEVVDKAGNLCVNDTSELHFSVKGNATLLAVGSADIKSLEPYMGSQCKPWKGRAIAVVRSGKKPGSATLTVTAKGMKTATVKLRLKQ